MKPWHRWTRVRGREKIAAAPNLEVLHVGEVGAGLFNMRPIKKRLVDACKAHGVQSLVISMQAIWKKLPPDMLLNILSEDEAHQRKIQDAHSW